MKCCHTQNSLGCRCSLCTSTKSVSSFIADPCVIRCHLMSAEIWDLSSLCTLSAKAGRKCLGINPQGSQRCRYCIFFIAFFFNKSRHHQVMHIAQWFHTKTLWRGHWGVISYTRSLPHKQMHFFILTWPFYFTFTHVLNYIFVRHRGGAAKESDCSLPANSLIDAHVRHFQEKGQTDRQTEVN